jgi:hypothetical protein
MEVKEYPIWLAVSEVPLNDESGLFRTTRQDIEAASLEVNVVLERRTQKMQKKSRSRKKDKC